MRIRRSLTAVLTGAVLSVGALVATPAPATAQVATQIDRCWETSWVTGWLTGIAGHCVFDGQVYWYDFNGGWGYGWAV